MLRKTALAFGHAIASMAMPHLLICVLVSLFCFFTMSPDMVTAEGVADGNSETEGGEGEARGRVAAGDFTAAWRILSR